MARKPQLVDSNGIPKPRGGHLRYSTTARLPKAVRRARRRARRAERQLGVLRQRAKADPYAAQVKALTQLQYAPQQRELGYQRQVEAQRQANLPNFMADYQAKVKAAVDQTNAQYAATQQAAYGQANQMAATDQTQIAQQTAQRQAEAAKLGQTVDPQLQVVAQQAAQQRQSAATAWGGLIGAQGAAQGAIGQGQVIGAAAEGVRAQGELDARSRKLDQLASDLAAEIGQFKVKARGDLQDAEQRTRLENAVFELDVKKEDNDQKNAAADRRQRRRDAKRKARQDRRKFDADRADEDFRRGDVQHDNDLADRREQRQREQGAGKGEKKNAFTPTQVRDSRESFRTLMGWARSNPNAKAIPDGYSNDPLMLKAVAQIIKRGGVDGTTAKRFRAAYGFTPRTRSTKVKRPPHARGPKGQGNRPT